jgi:hypothetical protein
MIIGNDDFNQLHREILYYYRCIKLVNLNDKLHLIAYGTPTDPATATERPVACLSLGKTANGFGKAPSRDFTGFVVGEVPKIEPDQICKDREMVIRIASAVLSLAALLALISGFLFWTGTALNSIQLHMLLGFLAVGALLVIAAAQVFAKGGSWSLAAAAVVLGAATIALGITQTSLMIGNLHWIVEIVHLLLGLLIVGLGHMLAARYRRNNAD